jgi:hypothetical protein
MAQTALIQVLGAVAYGEHKAHELAAAKAHASTSDTDQRIWRKQAAEELRHYKGFVRCLEAMGADPRRAMLPYQGALDHYHGAAPGDEIQEAMRSYLGEGIANDLLLWLRQVTDEDTAHFITTVLADEEDHEQRAAADLRALLARDPEVKGAAVRASREMLVHMISSGRSGGSSIVDFTAFLRVGEPHVLLARLVSGFVARLRSVGINPARLFIPPVISRALLRAS